MRRHKKNTMETSGLGLLDVIQIVLIVLKLVGVIDWSWWVVLIPLWFGLCVVGILAVAMFTEYHKSKV